MNGLRTAFLAALLFLTTARACPAGPLDRVRQAFVDVSVMSYAPDGEATERFVRYSDYGRANDVLLLQLYTSVHLPDGEVRRLLGLFDAGGFWSDIDYDDRTRGRWQPSLHLTRMYALAKLYADPASAWHGDGRIGGLLHKGLAYWYAKKPSSLNWWHGEIGVPKKLAAILLMIRGELSGPELEQGLRIIERSRFGRTGQNKVWLAGNNLMRGLLTDDEALVAEARDQIAEEIVVTDGEGIQDDWSFHQHGPQIQFGNYGLAYAEGLSFWLRVLDGTPYMFSDAQCAVIEKRSRKSLVGSRRRGEHRGAEKTGILGFQAVRQEDTGAGEPLRRIAWAALLRPFGLRHLPYRHMVCVDPHALRPYDRLRVYEPGEHSGQLLG